MHLKTLIRQASLATIAITLQNLPTLNLPIFRADVAVVKVFIHVRYDVRNTPLIITLCPTNGSTKRKKRIEIRVNDEEYARAEQESDRRGLSISELLRDYIKSLPAPSEVTSQSLAELKIEVEVEDDGRWIAEVLELPGVLAYGASKEEAITKVKALALQVIADLELEDRVRFCGL
jgi:predicted RNase H-like HicB family nuclease